MIEVDFKDRIPTHAGRIKLTPVSGQPDTFTMERADDPTEEGTPIDKATLESIIKSRLTGRFYLPEVARIEVGTVDSIINPIPASGWINVTATAAKNGDYEVKASGSGGASFYPVNAFDGAISTEWMSNAQTGGKELFIAIKLSVPATVYKMKMQVVSTNNQNYTISGSNDGEAWTELGTFKAAADGYLIERNLVNTGAFLWYKISCVGEQYSVREFELSEYKITTFENAYIIDNGIPLEWTYGQRITLEVPNTADTMGIIGNTLNGIHVNTILQPSRKYELVYNGSTFDAKEV